MKTHTKWKSDRYARIFEFDDIDYTVNYTGDRFGTPEKTNSGLKNQKINNISDAHLYLQEKISSVSMQKPKEVVVKIHVYNSNKKLNWEKCNQNKR